MVDVTNLRIGRPMAALVDVEHFLATAVRETVPRRETIAMIVHYKSCTTQSNEMPLRLTDNFNRPSRVPAHNANEEHETID